MKDYKAGIVRCRCSNEMRKGKLVKVYRYTPERKRCPNCGKMRTIQILKKKLVKQKVLIR